MTARGFSIVELVVALTLSAIAASAGFSLLNGARRAYETQAARIELAREVRAAVSILAGEFRQLDATDSTGSDIVSMSPGAITYRATRAVRFLCGAPDSSALRVTLAETPRFGSRELATSVRSALLYASGDSSVAGRWLRVTPIRQLDGAFCPGDRPGTVVWLSDVSAAELSKVESGAPIRSVETVRVQAYPDADGSHWLGVRSWGADGSAGDLQPFAGPVAAGGLELRYFDADGLSVSEPHRVSRIGLAITGRNPELPGRTFQLGTEVFLRNGSR